MTDLARHIQQTRLCDTHEHLNKETEFVERGPDVLQDLFGHYVGHDLGAAGASAAAIKRLLDNTDGDLAGRFAGVRPAWERVQHTGFGEATRLIAHHAYGMDEITTASIEAARARNEKMRQPGERLRILKEVGNLDHVQVDDFVWACLPDKSGLDFFFYDLSWLAFCDGQLDAAAIHKEVGVEVKNLATLREAMAAIFAKYAPCAIAVKSQHAYSRTLAWQERADADVERVVAKRLAGVPVSEDERLCLGDWAWAQGVELATHHNLPFKIHTGYYAGNNYLRPDWIRAGNLCGLLTKYPQARFVLMHIAYPYQDELVAIAKHFSNVWVDLCWAWGISPVATGDFLRQFIHTCPANKLFVFGGDTFWPNAAVAYSLQTRRWLTRTLQTEVDDGLLTERDAIALATRFVCGNQAECFDLAGKRAAIRAAAKASS